MECGSRVRLSEIFTHTHAETLLNPKINIVYRNYCLSYSPDIRSQHVTHYITDTVGSYKVKETIKKGRFLFLSP